MALIMGAGGVRKKFKIHRGGGPEKLNHEIVGCTKTPKNDIALPDWCQILRVPWSSHTISDHNLEVQS